MTLDDQSDQHDDGLTAEEEAVRRLLVDARHDEPMPGDVAARLDSVLARLAGDREAVSAPVPVPVPVPVDPRPGVVVDLAARRRRKVLVGLVAAAAVVVVGGVGVREIVSQSGDSDSAQTVADAGEPADRAGGRESDGDAPAGAVTSSLAPSAAGQDSDALDETGGRLILTSSSFLADVTRLASQDPLSAYATGSATQEGEAPAPSASGPASSTTKAVPSGGLDSLPAGCLTADLGPGRLLAVTYDGAPAVLALRPPTGQSQVVDLLACGGTILRSVTLPR